MLNDKAVPYNILKIYDGLSYRCACGQIDMSARDFIAHTNHGVVQKFSQIHRPPWFDWIKWENLNSKNLILKNYKILYINSYYFY